MGLPSFSVKRPITVIMFLVGVILFGFISWYRLPQELYPPITYPQLSVVTMYKDAAPEEMEALVTKPIEEAVGTVSGVRRITSTSKEEISLVIAEFSWGTNMDFAALGVREKIDLIKETLPRGSDDPIVMKFNPFELPLMVLNISAQKMSSGELQHLVKKTVKSELEKADGVAAVNITGGLEPEILIEVDHDKLMSKEVAINDVVDNISKANLNYPAGTIEESFYEYLIRTVGEFQVVSEMEEVVIDVKDREKQRAFSEYSPEDAKEKQERHITDKRLVLIEDIAEVKDTYKERTSVSRYNKKENVSVSIQKQADANTLMVANNVKIITERLRKMLPKDVRVDIVYDQSAFVSSAISGVRDAAVQGGILAFLVLLLFLGSGRLAAVVALNIPISIMAVFSLMYFSGITINMISLGGLALGVGMLVDNGIVVLENIYRYRKDEKMPALKASVTGANEVSGAIVGSTLTTIAVFLPMVFVVGIAGQLFKELAFTVTFSLIGSLVVALSLIPILSCKESYYTKLDKAGSKTIIDWLVELMQKAMRSVLVIFLKFKFICLMLVFGLFVAVCLLIPRLDVEFLPKVDQGQYIVNLTLPPGTKLEVTDELSRLIESYLFDRREIEGVTVTIGSVKEKKGSGLLETRGPHQAQIIVNLKKKARWNRFGPDCRTIPTAESLQKLKEAIKGEDLKGAHIEYLLQESAFKSAFASSAPVVIEIKGQDLSKLRQITKDVEMKLRAIPGIFSVRNTFVEPAPEVKINVFKEKAATFGLSVSEIAVTAQTAVKGYMATKFKKDGDEIDIKIRLREQDRDDMAKVRRLNIRSPLGIDVPLAEVAYFTTGKGPSEIKRQDQERTIVVTANIFKRSFKEIANTITLFINKLTIPSGYSVKLAGEQEQIQDSFNSLKMALILSIILVFMIMASQFESLWQPFVIMFTIPLSIIGVILILLFTNTPLSVMVILGVIVLGGIVVNNGIVLIDYTNILRRAGMSAYDAVLTSSMRRLRPIIMTALTTILGLVPLAFALNEGAQLQQPMAIAVIGGLAVATFLSLVVIPTIYMGMEGMLLFIRRKIFRKTDEVGGGSVLRTEEVLSEVVGGASGPEQKPEEPTVKGASTSEQPGETPEVGGASGSEQTGELPDHLWDTLTPRHIELINYLKVNKQITRKEYSKIFNISIPTASRDLRVLMKKGVIIAEGPSGAGRYYVLI
ncbi:MAG: efflux RND transporter permease subunit [Candidatus Omnitrophota bacterium]